MKSMTKETVLITGGAGFVGINLANRLLETGYSVLILDNLSRPGVESNLMWLRQKHNSRPVIDASDIRDFNAVLRCVKRAHRIYHFAAQGAVTTSLRDPLFDFDVNARGTLNVLEAIRSLAQPVPLVFTSTNKVYGAIEDILLRENDTRYEPYEEGTEHGAINELRPLDPYSPYGCSKGTADQYVRDYSRTYGLPAVVFRMSCIYGPRQLGSEDQGWVAHFVSRTLAGLPIFIYGNGLQVCDILYVEDLVDALVLAMQNMPDLTGQAFNIGGGYENTVSLMELIDMIREISGVLPEIQMRDWRLGDQRYYVSDIRKFHELTGWTPRVSVREGIQHVYDWALKSVTHNTAQASASGRI